MHTVLQTSYDDGATFSPPRDVGLVDSDMGFAAVSLGLGVASLGPTVTGALTAVDGPMAFLGDFIGVAATQGATFVVRAEPVRTRPGEQAVFPPLYHHQRIWVVRIADRRCGVLTNGGSVLVQDMRTVSRESDVLDPRGCRTPV